MGCGVVLHPTYLEADGLEELAKLAFRGEPDLLPFGEAPSLRTRQRPTFFEGQPESAGRTQELAYYAHEPPLVLEGEHRLVQEDGIEGGGIYRGTKGFCDDEGRVVVNPLMLGRGAGQVDGLRRAIEAQDPAPRLPRQVQGRAASAAAEIQHPGPRAHARGPRQVQDLTGGYEALLADVFSLAMSLHVRGPQGRSQTGPLAPRSTFDLARCSHRGL